MSSQKMRAPFRAPRTGMLRLDNSPRPAVQRAREPITRSRGLVRGQFPSAKTGQMVAWESQLEEKACYLFEFCSAISGFRDQPQKIEYPCSARIRTYYPDFELTLRTGETVYVEIKPLLKLFQPDNFDRFRCIANAFEKNEQSLYVLTEEDLPSKQRVRNLVVLRSYVRHGIPETIKENIAEWVRSNTAPIFQTLINAVGSRSIALALIAQQKIAVDLEQPLSVTTAIFSIEENCHETRLFTCRTGPDFERCSISLNSHPRE